MWSIGRLIILVSMIVFFGTSAAAVDFDVVSAFRRVEAHTAGVLNVGGPYDRTADPVESALLPPTPDIQVSFDPPFDGQASASAGFPANATGLSIRCSAGSTGADLFQGVPIDSWAGDSSCTMNLTFQLHDDARATLNFNKTMTAKLDATNSLTAGFQGPGGPIFSQPPLVNSNDNSDAVGLLYALTPGSYTFTANGSTQSVPITGSRGSAIAQFDLSFAPPHCGNGIDDDADGLTDGDDPDCSSAGDISELPDCSDGADNDLDGLVDGADPGCEDATDQSELDPVPVPGLGPVAIALLLAALGATAYWRLRKSGSAR